MGLLRQADDLGCRCSDHRDLAGRVGFIKPALMGTVTALITCYNMVAGVPRSNIPPDAIQQGRCWLTGGGASYLLPPCAGASAARARQRGTWPVRRDPGSSSQAGVSQADGKPAETQISSRSVFLDKSLELRLLSIRCSPPRALRPVPSATIRLHRLLFLHGHRLYFGHGCFISRERGGRETNEVRRC